MRSTDVRAGKGELIGRWEREPGRSILRRFEALAGEMQFPGHGHASSELLAVLGGRDLRGAPLRGCVVGLDLAGWDFSYAQLDLDFVECDLSGAIFDEAAGHSIMLLGKLEGASFRRARITYGDFRDARARGACFDGATLTGSWFEGTDLTNASFRDAKCKKARFSHARVVGCDFRRANLDEAVFVGARLNASTTLDGASMARVNRLADPN
jgi:uncharacterized protein YjbI with pentapeptide repeats